MTQDIDERRRLLAGSIDAIGWRDVLDFERGWSGSPAAKGRAVRARFGISPTRYHQQLNRLLDLPKALEYDPMLVHRLRRLRERRRQQRYARRLGLEA